MRSPDWTWAFWRCLKAALLATGEWAVCGLTDRLSHEGTGCEVRLMDDRQVRFRRPDRRGSDLLASENDDPQRAALDVAEKINDRLRQLRQEVTR